MKQNKKITSKVERHKNGTFWYDEEGRFHREDGPAVDWNTGLKQWRIHGNAHRLDGPAIIRENGTFDWCINNHYVTDLIFSWAVEMQIDLDNLTEDDKILIAMKWGNYGK